MQVEWVGWSKSPRIRNGVPSGSLPLYVLWCDPPLLALHDVPCPLCDTAVPFSRVGGILETLRSMGASAEMVTSISESCAVCGAQLHFETTPEEQRSLRQWLQQAVKPREEV